MARSGSGCADAAGGLGMVTRGAMPSLYYSRGNSSSQQQPSATSSSSSRFVCYVCSSSSSSSRQGQHWWRWHSAACGVGSPSSTGRRNNSSSGAQTLGSWGVGRVVRDRRRGDFVVVNADKKISFGDQLLDYIEGGPKLRKWYGAPDQLPKDGGSTRKEQIPQEPEEEEEEQDVERDVVLVTDADSETGQLVVLELILRRSRVRALVKDIKAATVGFGAYVEPVEGDVNDKAILRRALRGVRAIICPTKVGELADKELVRGVEHFILLSKLTVNRKQGGLGALFGNLSRRDAEENEAAISALGVPCTIVRAGSLKDETGGQLGFCYGQDGDVEGTISREDAAFVCVEALDSPPQNALVFEVVNGEEEVEDWSAVFTSLKETTSAF